MLRGSLSFDSSTSAGLRVTCVYPGFIPTSHHRGLIPRLQESSSVLRIIACIGFNCRLVDDQNADLRPRSGPHVEVVHHSLAMDTKATHFGGISHPWYHPYPHRAALWITALHESPSE